MQNSIFYTFNLANFPAVERYLQEIGKSSRREAEKKLNQLIRQKLTKKKFWLFGKTIYPTKETVKKKIQYYRDSFNLVYSGDFRFEVENLIFYTEREFATCDQEKFVKLCKLALRAGEKEIIFSGEMAENALSYYSNSLAKN